VLPGDLARDPQVADLVILQEQILKSMRDPGIPSDSLEITMSAAGLQNPANPSM
jgi:hypothetical protein